MVLREGALQLHHQGKNCDLNNEPILPLSRNLVVALIKQVTVMQFQLKIIDNSDIYNHKYMYILFDILKPWSRHGGCHNFDWASWL